MSDFEVKFSSDTTVILLSIILYVRVGGILHTCGSIPGSDVIISGNNTGGYILAVSHTSLNPYVDIIPNVTYTVEVTHENSNKTLYGVQVDIWEDGLEGGAGKNDVICPSSLQTPIKLMWTPESSLNSCVTIKVALWENDHHGFSTSLMLCRHKGCRQYVRADSSGTFSSPGFPVRYPDNYNCTYIVYSPSKQQLRLQFRSVEFEEPYDGECFDFIEIRTTADTKKYCGVYNDTSLNVMNFHSQDGFIFLTMISDYKGFQKGFEAFYYIMDSTKSGCNYTISNITGVISSPNYPDKYFPGTVCTIKIILPDQFRISIQLDTLSLDEPKEENDCLGNSDSLQFKMDEHTKNSEGLIYCGRKENYETEELTILSSWSSVSVIFKSNGLHESIGFSLYYNAIESCKNETYSNIKEGNFSSINFPNDYLNNQDCFLAINVSDDSSILKLKFDYFYTTSYDDSCMNGDVCDADFVELYIDGITRRMCGYCTMENTPNIFYSTTGYILLRFVSNSNLTRPGYYGVWETVTHVPDDENECSTVSMETNHSWYDIEWDAKSWIDADLDCKGRGGSLAKIPDYETQTNLEILLEGSNCSKLQEAAFWIGANDRKYEADYYWADQSRVIYTNWFQGWPDYEFRIKQPSDDGLADEDCVEIRKHFPLPIKGQRDTRSYHWNDRNCLQRNPYICQRLKGAATSYVRLPEQVSKTIILTPDNPEVDLTSPNFPRNYHNFLDITFSISSSHPFHRIHVSFEAFDLEPSPRCMYDNLSLSSFPDTSEEVIRCDRWNGKVKLLDWISQSNQAFLRFRTDNSMSDSGFRASVVAKEDPKCKNAFQNVYSKILSDADVTSLSDSQSCYILVSQAVVYVSANMSCEAYDSSLLDPSRTCNFLQRALRSSFSGYRRNYIGVWIGGTHGEYDAHCRVWNVRMYGEEMETCDATKETYTHCNTPRPYICEKAHGLKDQRVKKYETIRSDNGELQWPKNSSMLYENNLQLEYNIESDPGYRVFLTLVNFSIEFQENCLYDFLRISGVAGNSTTLCGNISSVQNRYFLSTGNILHILFKTDSSVVAKGFRVTWKWIRNDMCIHPERLDSNSGDITSVNFPLPYPSPFQCCKTVSCDDNSRLIFSLDYLCLNTEKNSSSLTLEFGNSKIDISEINRSLLSRTFISDTHYLKFCLSAEFLQENEGFQGVYSISSDQIVHVMDTIHANPGDNHYNVIQSLHYPLPAPLLHEQTIRLITTRGFKIILEFVNISLGNGPSSKRNFLNYLEIKDISLGEEYTILLANFTAESIANNSPFVVISHLNCIQIRLRTTKYKNIPVLYLARYSVIEDADYLEKTKALTNATFSHCFNDTCFNGGYCAHDPTERYRCICDDNFTGLYCQTFLCDLHPCSHGVCHITESGPVCVCKVNFWGEHCNMTKTQCKEDVCHGQGVCSGPSHSPACTCNDGYSGDDCTSRVKLGMDAYRTGEKKLLNEPIWIGMIVVLNLAFAFTSMFVVRRRCEKKFKCCREVKSSEGYPDTRNFVGTSSDSLPCLGDMYKQYRYPAYRNDEYLKNEEEPEHFEDIESPSVDSGNHKAAAKLFASYKRRTDLPVPVLERNPSILDTQSRENVGGMVGGTLNFCASPDDKCKEEMSDCEVAEACFEAAVPILKISELGMASLDNNYTEVQMSSDKFRKSTADLKHQHCYPEIVVINSTPTKSLARSPIAHRRTSSLHQNKNPRSNLSTESAKIPFRSLDIDNKRKCFASKNEDSAVFHIDRIHTSSNSISTTHVSDYVDMCVSELSSSDNDYVTMTTDWNCYSPETQFPSRPRSVGSFEDFERSIYHQKETHPMNSRKLNLKTKSNSEELCNYDGMTGRKRHRSRMKRKRKPRSGSSVEDDFKSNSYELPSTKSDSNLHAYKPRQKYKRSKKQREISQSISRMLAAVEQENEKVPGKMPIRKSRSNDLRPNRHRNENFYVIDAVANEDINRIYSKMPKQRRHSYHIPQTLEDSMYNPDRMLTPEPKVTYGLKIENDQVLNEIPSMPEKTGDPSFSSDVSGACSVGPQVRDMLLKVPVISDTDTGFSSSSRSLFSNNSAKDDSEALALTFEELKRMDSAYQSRQNSDDVINLGSNASSERNHASSSHLNERKDNKVYKRLQQAALKLQALSSSDSAVQTTVSEDDSDDMGIRKKRFGSANRIELEEVSEEDDITCHPFPEKLASKDVILDTVFDIELKEFNV